MACLVRYKHKANNTESTWGILQDKIHKTESQSRATFTFSYIALWTKPTLILIVIKSIKLKKSKMDTTYTY